MPRPQYRTPQEPNTVLESAVRGVVVLRAVVVEAWPAAGTMRHSAQSEDASEFISEFQREIKDQSANFRPIPLTFVCKTRFSHVLFTDESRSAHTLTRSSICVERVRVENEGTHSFFRIPALFTTNRRNLLLLLLSSLLVVSRLVPVSYFPSRFLLDRLQSYKLCTRIDPRKGTFWMKTINV